MSKAFAIHNVPYGQEIVLSLVNLLRNHDDTFQPMEIRYLKNSELLRKRCNLLGPSFPAFIEAEERIVQLNFLYAAYLGFRTNLENFHSPTGNHFLALDYTEFLKEHLMGHSEASINAGRIKELFRCSLPAEYEQCYEEINEYFIALDVVGPKLAHYWGYQFANKVLPLVEPGYCPDRSQTTQYGSMLEKYLGFYPPDVESVFKNNLGKERIA